MNKQHILDEIKRTAEMNGGVPLGQGRFSAETGIRYADWFGKYWARWGDAVEEAGLPPNKMQDGYPEELLIKKYIELTRELGHIPVKGEIRLKRGNDLSFPNDKTFFERFGSKGQLVAKVLEYCKARSGFEDVIQLCPEATPGPIQHSDQSRAQTEEVGFVYLIKSGRHYKIGRTNALGRREYELAIQLPQKANTVHVIRTDDPSGIEKYWHTRFANRRANGEWFELSVSDVQAFKRRKFM